MYLCLCSTQGVDPEKPLIHHQLLVSGMDTQAWGPKLKRLPTMPTGPLTSTNQTKIKSPEDFTFQDSL